MVFSFTVFLNPPQARSSLVYTTHFVISTTIKPYLGIARPSLNIACKEQWKDSDGFFVYIYSGDVGKRASDSILKFTGDLMRFFYAEVRIKTAFKHQMHVATELANSDLTNLFDFRKLLC
jgi:hypothetical protein